MKNDVVWGGTLSLVCKNHDGGGVVNASFQQAIVVQGRALKQKTKKGKR